VKALVAVLDMRGFTAWSEKATPKDVQAVIGDLEAAFQEAFPIDRGIRLFAKGTGDGFMIVSEMTWISVREFCKCCDRTVAAGIDLLKRRKLTRKLAVGCGIAIGKIARVYVLGRYDYIGEAANRAAKIQAIAHNELCVDNKVADLIAVPLQKRPEHFGHRIPGKGWRVPPGKLARL
jgi:class 3 adenylate cyclase